MEYVYYTKEYQEYAEELKDVESLKSYTNELIESLNKAKTMSDQIEDNLTNLTGSSFEELKQTTMAQILKTITESEEVLTTALPTVVDKCEELAIGLIDIKDNEEELIKVEKEKKKLEDNPVDRGEYDQEKEEYSNISNYRSYISNLAAVRTAAQKLRTVCDMLKELDDANIELIKQFNDTIEEFSIQLFSLDDALTGADFHNFNDLPQEERMRILNKFVEEFENEYNTLRYNLRSNGKDGLMSILCALGYPFADMDGPFSYDSYRQLMMFLNTPYNMNGVNGSTGEYIHYEEYETRTPLEMIRAYMVDGESFCRSGLILLALDNQSDDYGSRMDSNGNWEGRFWQRLMMYMDGRGVDNNPTAYLYMETDYFKQNGGSANVQDLEGVLYSTKYKYDAEGNMIPLGPGELKWRNQVLIDQLKERFVKDGYMAGIEKYYEEELCVFEEEYCFGGMQLIEALDGRMDWNENDAVIPKECLMAYLNGASWEESGLARYCSKSETEFIRDFLVLDNSTVERNKVDLYDTSTYGWFFHREDLPPEQQNSYCSISTEELLRKIEAGEDVSQYIAEMKSGLRESEVVSSVGNYYDFVNQRNTQIAEESTKLYETGQLLRDFKTVRDLEPYRDVELSQDFQNFKNNPYGVFKPEYGKELDQGITDGYDYEFLFKNMTEDERVTFTYIYDHYGKDAGRSYVAANADLINKRVGKQRALEFCETIRGDNVITKEEYVADYMKSHPGSTELDAMNAITGHNRDEYIRTLTEERNYNPVRAEEVAADKDFTPKYYLREEFWDTVGDSFHVAGRGGLMGLNDLYTNIKHNVVPDMVKTPENYEAEYIIETFGDENSEYYAPGYAWGYGATRDIGHKAPAQILKAIPTKVTQAVGSAIDALDHSGEVANDQFIRSGGDYFGSRGYAVATFAIDYVASRAGASAKGEMTGAMGKAFAGSVAEGTVKNIGYETLDTVVGNETGDSLATRLLQREVRVIENGVFDAGAAALKADTGYEVVDKALNAATGTVYNGGIRKGTINAVDGMMNGEGFDSSKIGSAYVDSMKDVPGAVKGAAMDYAKSKGSDFLHNVSYNVRADSAFNKACEASLIYKDGPDYFYKGGIYIGSSPDEVKDYFASDPAVLQYIEYENNNYFDSYS